MTAPVKLAAFALAVAAAFGIGVGVGELVGPFDDDTTEQHMPAPTEEVHDEHGS